MQKLDQRHMAHSRNSSIELLKIIGIFLIVINHVIQSLSNQNEYMLAKDYTLDLSLATTNVQYIILASLLHCGVLGNTIFFICSAWFFLDSDKSNKRKILNIIMDVWVISVIILGIVYIIRGGNIEIKLIIKQLLPITYQTNWYITCYLLFYPLHPFLNSLINKMEQKTLLKVTFVLLFLYVFANFILFGFFFSSNIILWVTLYFTIAYIKYYLVDLSNNIKFNVILFGIGFLGNTGLVLLTNFLGLHFEEFSNRLLQWNSSYNPFLILMALCMLNIARNIRFENKAINYISSLSLLIYVFHENQLLRTFYRPLMWNYIYNQYGYEHILIWTAVLVVIVFCFGFTASIIYKNTIQNFVAVVCSWLYPIIRERYRKIEKVFMKLH